MKPLQIDKRSKFQRFDDKVGAWYMNLASTNKPLFIIMFPLVLVGDLLMMIPRQIDKLIYKQKYHVK